MRTVSTRLFGILLVGFAAAAVDGAYNCAVAQAPFSPQTIPAVPSEAQSFTLRLMRRDCEVFFSSGPDDRVVERTQDQIVVTVEYIPPVNAGGCTPETFPIDWTIGPFPAGSYTLTVVGDDPTSSESMDIATLQVTVAPDADRGARLVPATGAGALVALLAMAFLIGWAAIGRQR